MSAAYMETKEIQDSDTTSAHSLTVLVQPISRLYSASGYCPRLAWNLGGYNLHVMFAPMIRCGGARQSTFGLEMRRIEACSLAARAIEHDYRRLRKGVGVGQNPQLAWQ
jgi:hypothetical protein